MRVAKQPGTPQESFPGALIAELDSIAGPVATVLTIGYPSDVSLSHSAEVFRPEPARVQAIDVRALRQLGVAPVLGRSFEAQDAEPRAERVALLGYNYWQRRFDGTKNVIGRTFRHGDSLVRIVGVVPGTFSEVDLGSSSAKQELLDEAFERLIPIAVISLPFLPWA